MATSEVNICNQALRLIGANRITSLTENTTNSKDCAEFYSQCRDAVLRAHNWSFATVYRTLAAVTVPDEYAGEYCFAFMYPSDCLQIQNVSELGKNTSELYEVVNSATNEQIILTNISAAVASYTKRETDATKFDPGFSESLVFLLASKLALPVTQDMNKATAMSQSYESAIQKARSADVKEQKTDQPYINPWVKARWWGNAGY